ncbi:phosphatidylinositol 3,4,5-trisphosphate-dependent Rac exchanger 1 protein [Camelus ferus]|uniref:Phosphatidylinositol 3,4,5-trisphosphate-dependent Rac exchanger 1 protein n=1 Tax=Camelus ferus TaxID=419612 RepID=A0A8B8S6F1_CAMFR|nr:phosphatidylinositol 3,4,5-trisphosphate-dependent Rac exchanger 1 protein [Camelus ferus]
MAATATKRQRAAGSGQRAEGSGSGSGLPRGSPSVCSHRRHGLSWGALCRLRFPGRTSAGSQAAASGLCPDQCILKANGNNVMSDGAPEVPEHLQAFRSHWEEALGPYQWAYQTHKDVQEAWEAHREDPNDEGAGEEDQPNSVFPLLSLGLQLSPHEDSPAVSLTEDSVHLEQGMVRECMSTAGVQCLVLEKVLEPCGSSASPPRSRWAIPEACPAYDRVFVQDCGRLTALSSVVKTTFHYEFCHLRHRAGEHWTRGPPAARSLLEVCYPKTMPLVGHLHPMSYTQHCISTMPAASWKCLPAVDGDSQSQGGPGPELKQDHEIQDAYLQLFTKLDVSVKEMKQYVTQIDRLPSTITETTSGGSCDPRLAEESSSPPLVSEESEMDRTDHGGMKKVCVKLSEEDREDSGHDTMSYRDSYSECDSNQHSVLSYTSVRSDGSYLRSHEMRKTQFKLLKQRPETLMGSVC